MAGESERVPRTGNDLLRATDVFARDSRRKSWWLVGSSLSLLVGTLSAAAILPWWPARLAASILAALLMVRCFILYHDFMHGAILRGSRFARILFSTYGVLVLVPPRSWRPSHNFHHGNVGKVLGSTTGSFPILTTDMWRRASFSQRLVYRLSRHPLTIASAYLTVFLYSVCLLPLLERPFRASARRHFDSVLALAAHAAIIAALSIFAGPTVLVFALLLPLTLASAAGAYLFYAQHNFVGMKILPPQQWTYYRGALESSSYLKLGPVLRWFTGNIGYHHIHHLNPTIPFYRLPEAMAAIPELQHPVVTTLRPRDILASLRLKLWDPEKGRMVTYREAGAAAMRE